MDEWSGLIDGNTNRRATYKPIITMPCEHKKWTP